MFVGDNQAITSSDVAMSVSQPLQYSTEPIMQQLETQPITSGFGQLGNTHRHVHTYSCPFTILPIHMPIYTIVITLLCQCRPYITITMITNDMIYVN
jgi:hypothetical protein